MTGLVETFDVARRAGIFVFIVSQLRNRMLYLSLLEKYRDDFEILRDNLSHYYSDCAHESTGKKMRTGLVRKDAEVSLNKYVRVATGLNLLTFDFSPARPKEGTLDPNWVSNVIIASVTNPIFTNETGHSFDIGPRLKLILFRQLVDRDISYLLPMLHAINELSGHLDIDNVRQSIRLPFAESLLDAFSRSMEIEGIPHESARAMYGRMPFITHNIRLMKNGRNPDRGFLHLIDPRLNWLYDLDLVDTRLLCRTGELKVASFWQTRNSMLVDFMNTTIQQQDQLMLEFSRTLMKRYGKMSGGRPPLKTIIEDAASQLERLVGSLIPMNALRLLVTATSLCHGIHPSRSLLIRELKDAGYSLYRDYMAGEGYAEKAPGARHGSTRRRGS